MSGNARRLAEAANQITNPQPIEEAKQLGTVAPFNYNMELLKAMSADEDGEVKFAVSGFMLRIYGKSPSPDLVNFFKKVLNDAGRQYKIVAQSRFDVQYMTPKDTSGLFHGGFEGITVDTGSLIANNKELLDRFGKSVYDAVRKQFTSNSVQVGGAYAGTTSGGFNYGKGLGLSGIDIVRSMSPKGSIMGEAAYTPANDYEGEMAMTQLKSVIEKATETLAMLKPEAKMEAWVQSKITLCDEHISCVRDYLKHTPGSVE